MKTTFAKNFRMHRSAKLLRSLQIAALVVSTILGVALIAAIPVYGATDVDDTTPPELTALTFTPDHINTLYGAQAVTVTLSGTDDLSGVSRFFFQFVSPSVGQYQYGFAACSEHEEIRRHNGEKPRVENIKRG